LRSGLSNSLYGWPRQPELGLHANLRSPAQLGPLCGADYAPTNRVPRHQRFQFLRPAVRVAYARTKRSTASATVRGAAVDTVKTTAENLQRMESLSGAKDSYRQTLQEQTAHLDQELARYEAKLTSLIGKQDELNGVRDAIDQRCSGSQKQSNPLPLAIPAQHPAEPAIPVSTHQNQPLPVNLEAIYQKCKSMLDDDPSGSRTRACVDRELGH
jgi:hypothetical protein